MISAGGSWGVTAGSLEAKRRREELMDLGEGEWGWTQSPGRIVLERRDVHFHEQMRLGVTWVRLQTEKQ